MNAVIEALQEVLGTESVRVAPALLVGTVDRRIDEEKQQAIDEHNKRIMADREAKYGLPLEGPFLRFMSEVEDAMYSDVPDEDVENSLVPKFGDVLKQMAAEWDAADAESKKMLIQRLYRPRMYTC